MGSKGGSGEAARLLEEDILVLTGCMVSSCLFAGLAPQDAEDVVQDVWAWLVASDKITMITLAPWRALVLRNFLRRFLRRKWRESRFISGEGREGDSCHPDRQSLEPSATECRIYLDRLASRCQPPERRLLELMGAGYRLADAARLSGITHGSEQFHLKRIRDLARQLERSGVPCRLPARPSHHSTRVRGSALSRVI